MTIRHLVITGVALTLAGVTSGTMSYAQTNWEAPIVSDIGTCLQAKNVNNGSSVISSTCKDKLPSQMWRDDKERIVHNSGKCLTIRHTDKAVILYDCHGRANQDWVKSRQIIMNKQEGTCLDIRGSNKADDTPVTARACYGDKNQSWTHDPRQPKGDQTPGLVGFNGGVFSLDNQLYAGQYFVQQFANGEYKAMMQEGCNFVLYDPNESPVWTSGTHGKGKNCYLTLSVDNGVAYLNIFDGSDKRVWRSEGSDPNIPDVSRPFLQIDKDGFIMRESYINGHFIRELWRSKKPVPNETNAVLPNAYGRQTVSIDCLVSGADDEETSNRITVRWYAADGRDIGGTYRDGIRTCHGANDKWTLKNSEEAAYITVNTNGSDGYLMDQILLYRDGKLVRTHGGNDSRGWCLSTDNTDHNKGNFYGHSVDSKCPPTRRFNY